MNTDHLFLGDELANNRDMTAKGRRKWAKNVLTHNQVREIRQLYADGLAIREISRRYPIRRPAIKKVVTRQAYKNVL